MTRKKKEGLHARKEKGKAQVRNYLIGTKEQTTPEPLPVTQVRNLWRDKQLTLTNTTLKHTRQNTEKITNNHALEYIYLLNTI